MKKNFLILSFLLLVGCATPLVEQKEMLRKLQAPFSEKASKLQALRNTDLVIQARFGFQVGGRHSKPAFGDISVKNLLDIYHVNLLNPEFSGLRLTMCQRDPYYVEGVIYDCQVKDLSSRYFDQYFPVLEKAVKRSNDDLNLLYSNLEKLNAVVENMPSGLEPYIRMLLKRSLGERKTIEDFTKGVLALTIEEGGTGLMALAEEEYVKAQKEKSYQREMAEKRAVEQKIALQRKKEAEQRLKNAEKEVRNPNTIGEQVCKDGNLKYQEPTNNMGARTISTNGQILAFIEGHSPDFNRVKLRIKGYAVPKGTFSYIVGTTPSLNGISAPSGTIIWESTSDGWYLCQ